MYFDGELEWLVNATTNILCSICTRPIYDYREKH